MAKLTMEQARKWDAQAQSGFRFDIERYVVWSEKQLHKVVNLENGNRVEFVIRYHERWKNRTVQIAPALSVFVWRPVGTGDMYQMESCQRHELWEPVEKKNYSYLCKLSGTVNTDDYMPCLAA